MVIVLFAKYKQLQNLSFAISIQIVAVDLVISIVLTVLVLINLFAGKWVFGEFMCIIVGMLVFVIGAIRTILMFMFVTDRFFTIFFPFVYPKYRVKAIVSLCVFSWVSILLFGIIALALDCYTFVPILWLCAIGTDCSTACFIFINLRSFVVMVPITVIPIILYIVLLIKAQKIKKSAPESFVGHKDWKMTITFFLLFLSVFIVTVPSVTILVSTDIIYGDNYVPPAVYALQIFGSILLSLLVVTDPIIIM